MKKERTFHCKNEIIQIYYENIKIRLLEFIENILIIRTRVYFLNVTSGEQEILRKMVSLFSKLFLSNSS